MPHTGLHADELAHGVDDVVERGRVAGAVGEEDRVGVVGEQILGASSCTGCSVDARAALRRSLRTIEGLMPVSSTAMRGPVAVAVRVDFARA